MRVSVGVGVWLGRGGVDEYLYTPQPTLCIHLAHVLCPYRIVHNAGHPGTFTANKVVTGRLDPSEPSIALKRELQYLGIYHRPTPQQKQNYDMKYAGGGGYRYRDLNTSALTPLYGN